jgi:hypothetical protein
MVTKKKIIPLWTLLKNHTTVGLGIHTSGPLYHDSPAWPCTGARYPCICRQPPGKASALVGRDDSMIFKR